MSKIVKAFAIPPTGSLIKGEPDYQPFGQQLLVKLDGRLVTTRTHGMAVQRYNIPKGYVEGRQADTMTGHVYLKKPRVRLYGRVEIEMRD